MGGGEGAAECVVVVVLEMWIVGEKLKLEWREGVERVEWSRRTPGMIGMEVVAGGGETMFLWWRGGGERVVEWWWRGGEKGVLEVEVG